MNVNSWIKTELEIYGSANKKIEDTKNLPATLLELHRKWIELESILLDLESIVQADNYAELKQCLSDLISELKEG